MPRARARAQLASLSAGENIVIPSVAAAVCVCGGTYLCHRSRGEGFSLTRSLNQAASTLRTHDRNEKEIPLCDASRSRNARAV